MNLDVTDLEKIFDPKRIEERITEFSVIGKDPNEGITRPGLSQREVKAKEKAITMMEPLGLKIRIDPFGNVIGRREGKNPEASPIMTGSHLDTVQNGGAFDGTVGVVGALEIIHALNELNISTYHPIEIIIFTAEEPNRFGFSAFGSKGLSLKWNYDELFLLKDERGTPLPSVLQSIGIDCEAIKAYTHPPTLHAFIELHVEQGQRLYIKQIPIGIVLGITGIYREQVLVQGKANHSGTTPMSIRKDALMAASEIILSAERIVKTQIDEEATATVGHVQVSPNQLNTIPGEVLLIVEFRSPFLEVLNKIKDQFQQTVYDVEQKRKLKIYSKEILFQPPMNFSEEVISSIRKASKTLGFPFLDLFSMAGHDASHLASITRTGMIFVPSKDGFSHCPQEWTDSKDIVKGCMVLLGAILNMDGE
jgi:N-carbamoyl-L-amino-acid hydrolase